MSNLFMKNVVFRVNNSAAYAPQLSSVVLTPSTTTATWQGFNGGSETNVAPATYTLDITFAQNWTPEGFSTYLYDYEGDEATVTFEPVAGGAEFTATVRIVPPSVGGAVNAFAESSVSLPCKEKPIRTNSAAQ